MSLSRKITKTLTLSSLLGLVIAYNACGAGAPMAIPGIVDKFDSASSASSVDLSDQDAVRSKALQILSSNCTSCHTATAGPNGVFGLTDADHMIAAGLIVPGQPDQSLLFSMINQNRMPPAGPLGAADKDIIRSWIAGGGAAPSTPLPSLPPPSSPPSSPPPTVPVTGTLEQKAIAILQNNCYACHGKSMSGRLTDITNPTNLINNGFVLLANPAQSPLYLKITVGNMPIGGAKLSTADTDIILAWITAGAKPANPGTLPPPPALPPLGPTFKSLQANIFLPKCAGCHSGTAPPKGVRLDSYATIKSNLTDALKEISDNAMPKGGPALTAAEKKAIRDWQAGGALNN